MEKSGKSKSQENSYFPLTSGKVGENCDKKGGLTIKKFPMICKGQEKKSKGEFLITVCN